MSEYMDQAVALLQETGKKFGELVDEIAVNIDKEDHAKAHQAYLIAAEMDVRASQLSGEEKTIEGKCEVNNACAKVVIGDVSLRGNMQFELEIDGEWCKGHRDNSELGQVFYSHTPGKSGHILTQDDNIRVTFPLTMDE